MVGVWAARSAAASAPLLPDLNARLHSGDSTPWTILFVLTLITLLPAILMAMTPLVRLLVVFHFLRQALGTQTAPSNPTLLGLALMMTWFLMTPVLTQVDQQAVEPYRNGQITGVEAIDLNGNPGVSLFNQPATVAGGAASMGVAVTDPNLVAAAAAGQGSGDNTNAVTLASLATQASPPIFNGLVLPNGTVLAAGQTLLSAETPSNYYSGLVTTLGSLVSQVQTENTAQNASVTQLQTQNNAISSVNLNDEASALTTLERSYQAASQVFAILNTLMASALNLGNQSTVA